MHTALPSFEEWLTSFKALAKLLSTKHLRQRFVQTCCVGRHAHFKRVIQAEGSVSSSLAIVHHPACVAAPVAFAKTVESDLVSQNVPAAAQGTNAST
eukprot:6092746-Amphidinium_carterae.1